MKELDHIIKLLKSKENFCFVRFNDGEMMGIEQSGSVVARGDQIVNSELQSKLVEAIGHRQKNYWIGKPCSVCFPKHREIFDEFVESDYEYLTHAVLFCNNGHWNKFTKMYLDSINDRDVYWVSGEDQNLDGIRKSCDPDFKEYMQITVPTKDAWSYYEKIKDTYKGIRPQSIVNLSCGPMSRVLAYEWFKERPDCTFIDIGSTFDPYTRDVWCRCHNGSLKYCKECNFI